MNPEIRCAKCSELMPEKDLEDHVRNELVYFPFRCYLCPVEHLSVEKLKAHIQFHHPGKKQRILAPNEDLELERECQKWIRKSLGDGRKSIPETTEFNSVEEENSREPVVKDEVFNPNSLETIALKPETSSDNIQQIEENNEEEIQENNPSPRLPNFVEKEDSQSCEGLTKRFYTALDFIMCREGKGNMHCRLCDWVLKSTKASQTRDLTNHVAWHVGKKVFSCTLCDGISVGWIQDHYYKKHKNTTPLPADFYFNPGSATRMLDALFQCFANIFEAFELGKLLKETTKHDTNSREMEASSSTSTIQTKTKRSLNIKSEKKSSSPANKNCSENETAPKTSSSEKQQKSTTSSLHQTQKRKASKQSERNPSPSTDSSSVSCSCLSDSSYRESSIESEPEYVSPKRKMRR